MINWKLRLKNKTTLLTLLLTVVAFIYQILGIFEIVPPISQDTVVQIITLVINMLAMLGIVVDPTTKGISDSLQAMQYERPKVDAKEGE